MIGTPKASILTHGALCTSMRAHGKVFGLNERSRVLFFASNTFDAALQEVFTTIVFGGIICVPSEEERLDCLEEAIARMDVNFAGLTSTVAGLITPAKVPTVETLVLFGEKVKPSVVEKWLGHAKILNVSLLPLQSTVNRRFCVNPPTFLITIRHMAHQNCASTALAADLCKVQKTQESSDTRSRVAFGSSHRTMWVAVCLWGVLECF